MASGWEVSEKYGALIIPWASWRQFDRPIFPFSLDPVESAHLLLVEFHEEKDVKEFGDVVRRWDVPRDATVAMLGEGMRHLSEAGDSGFVNFVESPKSLGEAMRSAQEKVSGSRGGRREE